MDDMDLKKSETPVGGQSRREFLRGAMLLAGAVGLQGLPRYSGAAAAATDLRAFTSAQFGMELDGQFLTLLKSIDGGFATSDVVQEKIGPMPFAKKHLAGVKYTDIAIELEPAMPPALTKWIGAALNMNLQRKSGSIITADYTGKEASRLDFNNALISEFTVPGCDGASKDPAYLLIKMSPEFTRATAGKGGTMKTDPAAKQKAWLPANFHLQIQGLEEACNHVMKIEPLTVKQKVIEQVVGEQRIYQKDPSSLVFPNLVVYLPEANAGPFFQWFTDFVVNGHSTDDNEKAGFLDLMSVDRSTSVLRLNFNHLGIFSFAPVKAQTSTDTIRQVKIEMYCEQITI